MTRPTRPIATLFRAAGTLLLLLSAARGNAAGPEDGPPETILRLSDAQKADLLNQNDEASVDAARAGLGSGGGAGRAIHGEIGAMIGSNGARGAYGIAAIPLGEHADAVVSFEDSRYGRPR